MPDLITYLFFTIGYLASFAGITLLTLHLIDKSSRTRIQKSSHETKVLSLLESIHQKLHSKP